MDTGPSSTNRRPRALARLRGRLSFANVTAALALFVALGGSSYAAVTIGSAGIADNSVRSKDLRNNGVRSLDIRRGAIRASDVRDGELLGADLRDNTVRGADVLESSLTTVPRAQDAQTLGGKAASDFLASDRQQTTGLIRLAHGETRTVAASGPFTWKAACSDGGSGDTGLTVTVETTEAGSFTGDFGGGGQPFEPGSPATVFSALDSLSAYTLGFPLSAVAPSAAATIGIGFVGLNVAGANCVVNAVLWR
jgi:hypothetical protein